MWLPKGDFSNYQYFLKVESARSSWTETDEISFCKNRCKEAGPWWWVGPVNEKDCQESCDYFSKKETKDNTCQQRIDDYQKTLTISDKHKSTDAMRMNCNFARELIHIYRDLPEDAINIRYLVVTSDTLKKKSFGDLTEVDYYATDSACSTWKSICDLSKANKVPG